MRALGKQRDRAQELGDLGVRIAVAEHRQAEGRLGDEHVARHQLERRAGRIGDVLVVAGGDDAQAVAPRPRSAPSRARGRRDGSVTATPPSVDGLAVADRLRRAGEVLAVAQPHQVERLLRGQHRAVAGAGMVGMAVGDHAPCRPAGSGRYGSRRACSTRRPASAAGCLPARMALRYVGVKPPPHIDTRAHPAWPEATAHAVLDDATHSCPSGSCAWFAGRGWTPRAHQLELLAKARAGRSVLLIAPTGAGKTLAGFLPTLVELSAPAEAKPARHGSLSAGRDIRRGGGLHTLWIAAQSARRGHRAQSGTAGGRDEAADPRRDPHRDTASLSASASALLTRRTSCSRTPEQLARLRRPRALSLSARSSAWRGPVLHALVTLERGDLLSLGLARLFTLAPDLAQRRAFSDSGGAR